jgi:hypothetical protein
VLQRHHHAVLRPGGGDQLGRQAADGERVVSHRPKRLWQSGKQSRAVVTDRGLPAVPGLRCQLDLAAEHLGDGLVPQADPEQRHRALPQDGGPDDVRAPSDICRSSWGARPRRQDHPVNA